MNSKNENIETNFRIYECFYSNISPNNSMCPDQYNYLNERLMPPAYCGAYIKGIENTQHYDNIMNKVRLHFTKEQISYSGINSFYKFAANNTPFIVVPFYNSGNIIYLWARRTDSNEYPKTLNLKDVKPPIFNLDHVKQKKHGDKVYICEGVFDTLILQSINLNAVGVLGVHSFSSDLVKELLPYQVEIAFDNDDAGNQKSQELADMFWEDGKEVTRTVLPIGMDVTDYAKEWRKNNGVA